MSFLGNHPTRVDEKSRLKLPSEFRSELPDGGEGKQVFYITSTDGKRAEIWPIDEWMERVEQLNKISDLDPDKEVYMDWTSYYGAKVEMDGQGRLLLPQILRDSAKITADVVVIGRLKYLVVANREQFEAGMKPMTAEVKANLARQLS